MFAIINGKSNKLLSDSQTMNDPDAKIFKKY